MRAPPTVIPATVPASAWKIVAPVPSALERSTWSVASTTQNECWSAGHLNDEDGRTERRGSPDAVPEAKRTPGPRTPADSLPRRLGGGAARVPPLARRGRGDTQADIRQPGARRRDTRGAQRADADLARRERDLAHPEGGLRRLERRRSRAWAGGVLSDPLDQSFRRRVPRPVQRCRSPALPALAGEIRRRSHGARRSPPSINSRFSARQGSSSDSTLIRSGSDRPRGASRQHRPERTGPRLDQSGRSGGMASPRRSFAPARPPRSPRARLLDRSQSGRGKAPPPSTRRAPSQARAALATRSLSRGLLGQISIDGADARPRAARPHPSSRAGIADAGAGIATGRMNSSSAANPAAAK